jgi:hypothetical protein
MTNVNKRDGTDWRHCAALGVSLEEQIRLVLNPISTCAAPIGLARRARFRGLGPLRSRA